MKEETREEIYKKYEELVYGKEEAERLDKEFREYLDSIPKTKISQRRKSGPITISAPMDFGRSILKITSTPKEWENLYKRFLANPERFAWDFYYEVMDPVLKEIGKKTGRGIHGEGQDKFTNDIKRIAVWLYQYVSYQLKMPDNERAKIFNFALFALEKKGYSIFSVSPHRKSKRYNSKNITTALMENKYQIERRKYGIKVWDDPDYFYEKYILAYPRYKEVKEDFVKMTREKDDEASYPPIPLRDILNIK
ncbi:MAG: hypothetical protein K8I01_12650 [Candidatus Methylomirabilis sp.]|nr:hypothetical protein [Deltaproteobacteria bacterium]